MILSLYLIHRYQPWFYLPIYNLSLFSSSTVSIYYINATEIFLFIKFIFYLLLTSCKINSRFQRMAYLCGFCVLYR